MNKTILIGRLTADPELRHTEGDHAVANFTLAVDRPFKNQQGERDTDFIRCVVWRKLAEVVSDNLVKGQKVALDGRIQVRSYQDKEGNNRQAVEVVGENVEFLDKPRAKQDEDGLEINDSDLPF